MKQLIGSTAFWLALAYLALIPAFAFAFDHLGPDNFHDSNSQREKGAYEDAADLRESLTQALAIHLGDLAWKPFDSNMQVRLDPEQLDVTGIEFTSERNLLLEISGVYKTPGRQPLLSGIFHFWIEPTLRERASTFLPENKPPTRIVPVALSLQTGSAKEHPKRSPFQPPVSLVFPFPSGARSSTSGTFLMSEATYNSLISFYLGIDGDPAYASDHLLRMFYLSAVTITTLGFGDITPVSEFARVLVGLEAVLGVAVIGLFLSALAVSLRRRGAGT